MKEYADKLFSDYETILHSFECPMCGGWGHKLDKCGTFKAMESFASSCSDLGTIWEEHKRRVYGDALREAEQITMVGTIRKGSGRSVDVLEREFRGP